VPAVLIDPRVDPRWQRLVDRSPDASIFHHPAWIDLVARTYRYPVAAAIALEDGEPAAGLPVAFVASRLTGRRLVALPFSDACPPLVAQGAPAQALDAVVAGIERERERRGVPLEVRAAVPAAGTPVARFVEHRLDLEPGYEAVEKGWRSQTRRNVRSARKRGVTVERRTDRDALDAFYDLHLRTRRRQGVPTQPLGFIRAFERLFAAGLGHVGLAHAEGQAVAAAVFLRTGRTLTYKYGASHEDYLRVRPNNAVFADTIAWACEEGLGVLDFGRTDADQEGLKEFKRSWGAEERELAYTYAGRPAPEDDGSSAAERLVAAAVRRGPLPTGRVLGTLLYRHVG
jgi:CelD/BcsL family acetyltransferase involved in cellulose biosynthesis